MTRADSNRCSMRLAYADPPYPGYSHLYPEKTEVDHAELIGRLCEFDGWALSTNEKALAYVLGLCPAGVRVLAWCKSNAPPFFPNPIYSWEPVICRPARTRPVSVRSYFVSEGPTGFRQRKGITGQKSAGFCEWVIRCLGAETGDTLEDLFPGTGIMGEVWAAFQAQPPLFQHFSSKASQHGRANQVARAHEPLPGIEPKPITRERKAVA